MDITFSSPLRIFFPSKQFWMNFSPVMEIHFHFIFVFEYLRVLSMDDVSFVTHILYSFSLVIRIPQIVLVGF